MFFMLYLFILFCTWLGCQKMAWWLDHLKRCTVFQEEKDIQKLTGRTKKCVTSDGTYFEWTIFLPISYIKRVFF